MSWQEYFKIIQEDYHIESDDTVIKILFENLLDFFRAASILSRQHK